jgi:DnaK suppressor protein
MHAKELRKYKKLLAEKLKTLQTASADIRAVVPRAGVMEGDILDQASADAEAELQIRLHQTDGRLSRAIEEALIRIRNGTFGACEVCKQPVSKARLAAVPWTHVCRKCKERRGA